MRTEYVNSENSIFEKLCNTEKSQALIIVSWLGAPEEGVLKKLKQHITVVDLSRKVINFLIPNQKVKSPHNRARSRFDFSQSRKIYYISTASLPFISLKKLIDFFKLLRFDSDDINILFLIKDYIEAVGENHHNREINRDCFSDQSTLDSHLWSTEALYNFIFDTRDYFSAGGYAIGANNADLIITCNSLMTKAKESKTGNIQPSSLVRYPIIPLRRPKHSYPNKDLFGIISILAKGVTPFDYRNKFYGGMELPPTSQEFLEIFENFSKLHIESVATLDERDHWIFRTEEEQQQIEQKVWKARIEVQNYLINLPGIFPLKESDEEEPLNIYNFYE